MGINQVHFDQIQIHMDELQEYAKETTKLFISKSATEMSYAPALISLLEKIFPSSKGYSVISAPRKEYSKNKPDITVFYKNITLFNIEAKIPFTPIEAIIQSKKDHRLNEQIKRYKKEGQLLITDFLDFYLINTHGLSSGQKTLDTFNSVEEVPPIRFSCHLLKKDHNKITPIKDSNKDFENLLDMTCNNHVTTIKNIKSLVSPLARLGIQIRDKVHHLLTSRTLNLTQSENITREYLQNIQEDFGKSLFKEEKGDSNALFSDLFAQTLIYGTFSAWIKFCQSGFSPQDFTISIVGNYLPFGSFVRDMFLNLKNKTPHEFDDLFSQLTLQLTTTEYKSLSSNVESLISIFYSDFLMEYDPETARDRGVVYTPHEIVEYMIDGIDFALKRWLDFPDGIIEKNNGNKKLKILDPAAGTMAFASGLLYVAKERFVTKYANNPNLAFQAFESWVKDTFFENMYAFEILMAPYVLGQIRTFLTLDSLGVKIDSNKYLLRSFLMNTLMTPPKGDNLDKWTFKNQDIGKEIKKALLLREKGDVFVIMGNPPYNLSSQNESSWIKEKIEDYKKNLNEKNLKILSDDYVKFIRFGQWKIEQVGKGVLAFITNNKYLDGQIFPVMRKSLRKTFDHIYIVNLHGDMRKDESGNPFNIRVGVAIAFMIRVDNSPNKNAAIHYMDIPQNNRGVKFMMLEQGFDESMFKLLAETKMDYFVELNMDNYDRYQSFTPIDELFEHAPKSGIMAGKERLLVDVDSEILKKNLGRFFSKDKTKWDELIKYKINIEDKKYWKKEKVLKSTNLDYAISKITKFSYRGFDYRHISYDTNIIQGSRKGYIDQVSPDNLCLALTKSSRNKEFDNVLVTERMIEKCFIVTKDSTYAFLYKYNGKNNFFLPSLSFDVARYDSYCYMYAVLWSDHYRKKYNEYLLKGYPRIFFTENEDVFLSLADLGNQLISAHLVSKDRYKISPKLVTPMIAEDGWKIEKIDYDLEDNILYLNDIAWINGITLEMWNFTIGKKKQLEQFLKSRRFSTVQKWNHLTRALTFDELTYFLKICTSIQKTLEIISEIDELYQKIDD